MRSRRPGSFSRNSKSNRRADGPGNGCAGSGQEHRIEPQHGDSRRRQRTAEDQHSDKAAGPSRLLPVWSMLQFLEKVWLATPDISRYSSIQFWKTLLLE